MRSVLYRAMVLGMLASTSLFIAGCGGDETICSSANCGGCCDQFGNCRTDNNTSACGTAGATCQVCDTDETCQEGECSTGACGPDNCDGCCKGSDCKKGNTSTYCGTKGKTCDACTSTEVCNTDSFKCETKACDATTCQNGCCFNQKCQTQNNPDYCGTGGKACAPCTEGQICENQECKVFDCTPTSCSTGCCDSRGVCQKGDRAGACGTGGNGCIGCGDGLTCDSISRSCKAISSNCNSGNCPTGCCDQMGVCQVGTNPGACGSNGNLCEDCGAGGDCENNQCKCTQGGSCTGCCDGNKCKPGSEDFLCGSGGEACEKCVSPNHCDKNKNCSEMCGFPSCDGCCEGETCKSSNDADFCGRWGGSCSDCKSGEACWEGICNNNSLCGTSCNGCCKDSVCQAGNADNACGLSGGVCQVCSPNQECDNGNCIVKPSSRWNVYLKRIVVKEPPSGNPWDSSTGYEAPDVFIVLKVGGQTATGGENEDTFDNAYDQYLLTETAQNLMNSMTIEVRDDDLFGSELIDSCVTYVYEWELRGGYAYINGCGNNVSLIEFSFTPAQ